MADTKISAMPTAATLTGTEIVPLVQSAANKQQTVYNIVEETIEVNPAAFRATLGLGSIATQNDPLGETHGGTGLTSYVLGDTVYASASNTLAKLAGNTTTTQKFLTQTGTGAASAAPIWKALSPSDINTQFGAFYFDYSTTVSQLVGQNATTINVVSTVGFSNAGSIIIGAELITYTGITATSFTGCTRGAAGSPNTSHAIGVAVNGAQTAGINTPTLLQINSTSLSNGVTLNTSTQEISVAVGGTYNFAFSAQLNNSATGQTLLAIWFAVDGVDVPLSASWATIAGRINSNTPASTIMAANIFLTLTSSNKVTMNWLTNDGHGSIVTYPASVSPAYPASPALILTVNQVS
jgi:hypothetical protein